MMKDINKICATYFSTGKVIHKMKSNLREKAVRKELRTAILKHMGFINVGMSEVLEILSEFKKHLGSFVERKDLVKDLEWE